MTGTSVQFTSAPLLANDRGVAPVTLVAVAPSSAGGGSISGTDPFTFTPGPSFSGTDSFTYEIRDGSGQTAIGVVTVSAAADATPPVVSITSPSGGLVSGTVTLTASASDNVGVAGLRFFDGTTPIDAEMTAAPFQKSWNTALVGNGIHNLTAVARDVAGNITTSAVVGVNVSNVVANVAPVANSDSATTNAGTAVTLPVLANDTDANGDALAIIGVSNLSGGSATVNGGTTITFQPLAGFSGTASFTYTISDLHGGTANGSATVIVLPPPNQPPVANPDAATTSAGAAVAVPVLANDTDPNGDPLTITGVSGAVGGSAAITGSTVTFTPAAGFSGAASFTYTISDGHGGSASTSVAVTVTLAAAVDKTVFVDGTGTRTTPVFSTAAPGEFLVAFAASDGPSAANAQTLTISGAGLTWTRVRSTAGRPGVVEILDGPGARAAHQRHRDQHAVGHLGRPLQPVAHRRRVQRHQRRRRVGRRERTFHQRERRPGHAGGGIARLRRRQRLRSRGRADARRRTDQGARVLRAERRHLLGAVGERVDRGGRHHGDAECHRAGAVGSIQLRDRRVEAAVGDCHGYARMDMDRTMPMKIRSTNVTRWIVSAAAVAYGLVLATATLPAQDQHQQQAIEPLIRGPQSLKGVPVPEPPNLGDFVMDRQAAIVLGKAFFWDMNAGSDETQACASCHFNAGADPRTKNALNPGPKSAAAGAPVFDSTASGAAGGPNYTLRTDDFPFFRLADPANRDSAVLFSSDDVVGSQGVVQSDVQLHRRGRRGDDAGGRLLPRRYGAQRREHAAGDGTPGADGHQRRVQLPQLLGRPRQQRVQRPHSRSAAAIPPRASG